jgi:hypothetical protein
MQENTITILPYTFQETTPTLLLRNYVPGYAHNEYQTETFTSQCLYSVLYLADRTRLKLPYLYLRLYRVFTKYQLPAISILGNSGTAQTT